MRTSGTPAAHQGAATLRDYLQVARRRKWIILQAVVLVPLAAVLFSLQQTPVYQASADVLLSRQNLANTLNGLQDPSVYTQAD
ncbi:MAG TPA: Wzz/FepE/Etk N-terminal domain-containing protein, partial [Gaiellaceae bacterium]